MTERIKYKIIWMWWATKKRGSICKAGFFRRSGEIRSSPQRAYFWLTFWLNCKKSIHSRILRILPSGDATLKILKRTITLVNKSDLCSHGMRYVIFRVVFCTKSESCLNFSQNIRFLKFFDSIFFLKNRKSWDIMLWTIFFYVKQYMIEI